MLPSNIHVTKRSKADSHLVLICTDLNYDVTYTFTITFMGGSREAEILTLVWIRWNNSMMKNQMVWWKMDCKNKGNGMFTLCSWELWGQTWEVSCHCPTMSVVAAAHVPCPNQWCGVRCSCSPSKMIAQGWHKLKYCRQMEWFTVTIDERLFHSYGNAVLTLVMHWGQKIHLW